MNTIAKMAIDALKSGDTDIVTNLLSVSISKFEFIERGAKYLYAVPDGTPGSDIINVRQALTEHYSHDLYHAALTAPPETLKWAEKHLNIQGFGLLTVAAYLFLGRSRFHDFNVWDVCGRDSPGNSSVIECAIRYGEFELFEKLYPACTGIDTERLIDCIIRLGGENTVTFLRFLMPREIKLVQEYIMSYRTPHRSSVLKLLSEFGVRESTVLYPYLEGGNGATDWKELLKGNSDVVAAIWLAIYASDEKVWREALETHREVCYNTVKGQIGTCGMLSWFATKDNVFFLAEALNYLGFFGDKKGELPRLTKEIGDHVDLLAIILHHNTKPVIFDWIVSTYGPKYEQAIEDRCQIVLKDARSENHGLSFRILNYIKEVNYADSIFLNPGSSLAVLEVVAKKTKNLDAIMSKLDVHSGDVLDALFEERMEILSDIRGNSEITRDR